MYKDLFIFIGKPGMQRGRETERKTFCPMIYSPSGHKGRSCANAKPGAWNIFWISHMGAGSQGLERSTTAFPGHKQGAGWEVELLRLEPVPIWDPSVFKVRTVAARPLHWGF